MKKIIIAILCLATVVSATILSGKLIKPTEPDQTALQEQTTLSEEESVQELGDVHLPYFTSTNRNFHIQQPGITICDNLLIMNKVMQEGKILYCFDDGTWQLYKGPVALPKTVKVVKAKVIYLDKESNTTWLWN
jgi:hypothetical protein